MTDTNEIRVLRRSRVDQMGSCNACTRRDDPWVTLIEFKRGNAGMSWRICALCERKLLNLLAATKMEEQKR